jgi:sugar lactone lactonase YvrE
MMAQIRDVGDGIRGGTYTMTAPVITGGSITGVALSGNTLTSPVITGGSINNTPIGASTANTGAFTTLSASGTTTLSANQIISVTDNSNAALRITQLGTGNALLVEDSTNPDSTPFAITSDGSITIGTTSTDGKINIVGDSLATTAIVQARFDSTASGPTNYIKKARGTASAPTIVLSGDTIGSLRFEGHDGTTFIQAANITAQVDGTPGTNDMPGRLVFSTTADGASSPTERLRINSAGNVGIATTAAAAKLQVAGNTILSNVDMLNASYDSVSFSVAGQEATPNGLFFSPDGSRMFVLGTTGDDVNQYSLSTPWVVSSASYVTVFSVASQDLTASSLFFRADGLKMYVLGNTNDTVFQYSLTTPWSVATATYDSVSFSVATEETNTTGIFFKPNGLTMYVVGIASDNVNQYTLSTAWDVSTATFTQLFSVAGQETALSDISFTGDGTRMFVSGTTGDDVTVYNLTTPWDISTSFHIGQFSVALQDSTPNGIYVKPDGTKFYMAGSENDSVYQYTIPSIDIQLTGTTAINGSATVAQDLTVDGNFSALNVYSGTYTPTLTNTTNIAASTAAVCQYMRVGNVVTVSGTVQIDPTLVGQIVLGMTLPIASALTAATQCGGTFAGSGVTTINLGSIVADATNDRATFDGVVADIANRTYGFTFTYLVI